MAALVGDMLLLASTDAGSWSIKQETVDMDTLLIETYELFEPVCQSSQDQAFPGPAGRDASPCNRRRLLL